MQNNLKLLKKAFNSNPVAKAIEIVIFIGESAVAVFAVLTKYYIVAVCSGMAAFCALVFLLIALSHDMKVSKIIAQLTKSNEINAVCEDFFSEGNIDIGGKASGGIGKLATFGKYYIFIYGMSGTPCIFRYDEIIWAFDRVCGSWMMVFHGSEGVLGTLDQISRLKNGAEAINLCYQIIAERNPLCMLGFNEENRTKCFEIQNKNKKKK